VARIKNKQKTFLHLCFVLLSFFIRFSGICLSLLLRDLLRSMWNGGENSIGCSLSIQQKSVQLITCRVDYYC